MSEDLQALMERIQGDALQKAQTKADEILAQAKQKADAILKDAQTQASNTLRKAEEDSKVFAERGARSLEQAARDVLIGVGQSVEKILLGILDMAVAGAVDAATLQKLIVSVATAQVAGTKATLALSPEDHAKLASVITSQFKKTLGNGIEVVSENGMHGGFRLILQDGRLSHEFTKKAIADALAQVLRPQIAAVVNSVALGR